MAMPWAQLVFVATPAIAGAVVGARALARRRERARLRRTYEQLQEEVVRLEALVGIEQIESWLRLGASRE
jgi:hypothetical protein